MRYHSGDKMTPVTTIAKAMPPNVQLKQAAKPALEGAGAAIPLAETSPLALRNNDNRLLLLVLCVLQYLTIRIIFFI